MLFWPKESLYNDISFHSRWKLMPVTEASVGGYSLPCIFIANWATFVLTPKYKFLIIAIKVLHQQLSAITVIAGIPFCWRYQWPSQQHQLPSWSPQLEPATTQQCGHEGLPFQRRNAKYSHWLCQCCMSSSCSHLPPHCTQIALPVTTTTHALYSWWCGEHKFDAAASIVRSKNWTKSLMILLTNKNYNLFHCLNKNLRLWWVYTRLWIEYAQLNVKGEIKCQPANTNRFTGFFVKLEVTPQNVQKIQARAMQIGRL